MEIKGYVTNNTGRSRHIFKRTVYPGQSVSLETVYKLLAKKVPEDVSFVDWLKKNLPAGWEVKVKSIEKKEVGGRKYKEVLTAEPIVHPSPEPPTAQEPTTAQEEEDSDEDNGSPSLEYATPRAIDKLTAKDIYNLRLKDNPKRILKHINSIHKLRRALTMCNENSRKATLTRLIQHRIKQLTHTL